MCNIPYIVNLMCLFEGNTEEAKTLLFSLLKLHSEWYPGLTPWCCAVVPWYSGAVLLRRRGLVIITTARLHSCSAQFQILLAACRRFLMVRIPDNVSGRKQGWTPLVGQPYNKNNLSPSSSSLSLSSSSSSSSWESTTWTRLETIIISFWWKATILVQKKFL